MAIYAFVKSSKKIASFAAYWRTQAAHSGSSISTRSVGSSAALNIPGLLLVSLPAVLPVLGRIAGVLATIPFAALAWLYTTGAPVDPANPFAGAGYGLMSIAVFVWIYIRVTPYDDFKEIAEGNMAPAIALAGAMLGFTFPVLVASYLHATLAGYVFWALGACVVQLAVFWAMYRYLPRIVAAHNTAGALCYATASVCAGLMNAASFIP